MPFSRLPHGSYLFWGGSSCEFARVARSFHIIIVIIPLHHRIAVIFDIQWDIFDIRAFACFYRRLSILVTLLVGWGCD